MKMKFILLVFLLTLSPQSKGAFLDFFWGTLPLCKKGYHFENSRCQPDVKSCTNEIQYSSHATRTWKNNQYGECVLHQCNSESVKVNNNCVQRKKSCMHLAQSPVYKCEGEYDVSTGRYNYEAHSRMDAKKFYEPHLIVPAYTSVRMRYFGTVGVGGGSYDAETHTSAWGVWNGCPLGCARFSWGPSGSVCTSPVTDWYNDHPTARIIHLSVNDQNVSDNSGFLDVIFSFVGD